jgi:hypothetical protein
MRFVVIPLLCLGIVLFFRTSDEGAVELRQKPQVRTSASALYQEYDNDRQAADQKYRDKVLQVSGAVMRVEQDNSGQIAVILQGAQSRFSGIECQVNPTQTQEVQQLRAGQQIIVKGYGAGKTIHVRLKGCLLVHSAHISSRYMNATRLAKHALTG